MAATPVLIPVDEYLNTMYHPDCDYVDGEVKERNLGETPHSVLEIFLGYYFRVHQGSWKFRAFAEQRVQVSASRYRIPDICVLPLATKPGLIIRTPPLLCIEILSREDTVNEILDRVEDYYRMGVTAVWLINPWRREAFSVASDLTQTPETESLRVENTPIRIPIAEIFQEVDSLKE
jgi:Uma2 family endonuclease